MTKEDYFKYYIQGSDHYLIPKDVFDELFDEMENWKEEAKELKKQLTTHQILQRDCYVNNLKNISKIEEMENQQKEFIEFITSYIELLSNKPDLIEEGQQDILKEVFDKFKEIIVRTLMSVPKEKINNAKTSKEYVHNC